MNSSGEPGTGSNGRQLRSAVWHSTRNVVASGLASRTSQRMYDALPAGAGGTNRLTSGCCVSTTTISAGSSRPTSDGVTMPLRSTVTMPNQYSPSWAAWYEKLVCWAETVSLQTHGSVVVLTYSCTSRSLA